MAYDRYTTEYHVTPAGWQGGNRTLFGKTQGETLEPPEDRVETWIHGVTQASGWSKEDHSWRLDWESNETTDADVLGLREKWGPPAGPPVAQRTSREAAKARGR